MGLIPAHAGKTGPIWPGARERWAHPRSRGENTKKYADDTVYEGSSPLTRGKHPGTRLPVRGTGLIPAHAGKTCQSRKRISHTRAHPRSRGENIRSVGGPTFSRGSSPLTRGKLGVLICTSAGGGLIPAHAGKTEVGRRHAPHPRAHPRSRGENLRRGCARPPRLGSSPLTRGKLVSVM